MCVQCERVYALIAQSRSVETEYAFAYTARSTHPVCADVGEIVDHGMPSAVAGAGQPAAAPWTPPSPPENPPETNPYSLPFPVRCYGRTLLRIIFSFSNAHQLVLTPHPNLSVSLRLLLRAHFIISCSSL